MTNLFLILYAGLEHAFEADHLLAVSSLVTNRKNLKQSMKDGIFWGIGHTTTLFVVGFAMIVLKYGVDEIIFSYFEAAVGLMLIGLGIYRLLKFFKARRKHTDIVESSNNLSPKKTGQYKAAFGVGFIHGLAGSGALAVLVISQMKSYIDGLGYILLFGFGSIAGMFIAAGLFGIPFAQSFIKSRKFQIALICISSVLCIGYGAKVVWENLSLSNV